MIVFQEAFDHDKGQKSAVSGRRLHWMFWIFSNGILPFSSTFSVWCSKKSTQNVEKIARFPGGEKSLELCHVSGCHVFYLFQVWRKIQHYWSLLCWLWYLPCQGLMVVLWQIESCSSRKRECHVQVKHDHTIRAQITHAFFALRNYVAKLSQFVDPLRKLCKCCFFHQEKQFSMTKLSGNETCTHLHPGW